MAIETRDVGTKRMIVAAGLNAEFAGWLEQELANVGVRETTSTEETMHALGPGTCDLLIINHTMADSTAMDVLARVRRQPELDGLPVIYLLDRILDSEVGRKILAQLGVRHVLLQPVEWPVVAEEIREALALPEPATELTAGEQQAPDDLDRSRFDVALAARDDHAFLLIVDDDRKLADQFTGEAVTRGMRVEVAPRPELAREIIDRARPDVILLYLGFPNATEAGLSFLEDMSALVPPIPVLVLTANDTFPDRVEAASLGARGFLPKTLSPSEVLDAVSRLLQQLRTSESRVMVVDDDPSSLAQIRLLLGSEGIRVTVLNDPLRFWDTLEQVTPDLVVLGLDTARLTGVELCRVVRNDPRWSALPVLMLTASSDPETVHRVFAAGADDFVCKPIVGPELVTKVVNRLERTLLYRSMAEIDPVTGVTNRRKSTESIRQFLRLAQRHHQPLSLALLDVDLFKQINDRFGHAAGDAVLQQLGNLLMRTFRSEDVVARWGGEEFLIGMYGMTRADGVQRLTALLETLREKSLSGPRGEAITMTFSAGVAQFPEDGTDLQSLYRAADTALYRAKANGRDRVMPVGWHADTSSSPTQSVDVVLVEDDEVQGSLVTQALEAQGYRTQWIHDGEAAALLLGGFNPSIRAPVILLDAELPEIDGMGVLRRLSRDGVLRHSRVITLLPRSRQQDVTRARELGGFDYVFKPYPLPVLVQRVRRALEVL